MVGVGVVAVVLAHPPPVAQPDGQIAVHQTDQVVGPLGPEDLPVAGVMAEEPDLGEHERQEAGHRELPPRVADQYEACPRRGEKPAGHGDLRRVVAGPPLQQAGGLDSAHQFGEVAAARRYAARRALAPGAGSGVDGGCW